MALMPTIIPILLILVFGLIGYARDMRRGVVALAGTLLGANLVTFWAEPWGKGLAERLGGGNTGMFVQVVSIVSFLATVLIIGYGSGLLLGRTKDRPTPAQRLSGLLLGLLNGVLIISYLLRFITANDETLRATVRSIPAIRLLNDGLPILFLGVALCIAALVIGRLALLIRMASAPAARKPAPPEAKPAPAPAERKPEAQPLQTDRKILDQIDKAEGRLSQ